VVCAGSECICVCVTLCNLKQMNPGSRRVMCSPDEHNGGDTDVDGVTSRLTDISYPNLFVPRRFAGNRKDKVSVDLYTPKSNINIQS